ncbi:MAG: hypothetical protein IJ226_03610 [Clostridia bacterium]|jgi:threonine/homoserine/homoserine lactone efflux protein|nr:hypothetical protein [Clostridia bacterium]
MFQTLIGITSAEMTKIINPILEVCKILVPALLAVVGAVGAIFCILLGVKYARASEPQEHENAKKSLQHAIVGFVLIFVLLIMLQVGITIFTDWWQGYAY